MNLHQSPTMTFILLLCLALASSSTVCGCFSTPGHHETKYCPPANGKNFTVSIVGLTESDSRYKHDGLPIVYRGRPTHIQGLGMDTPSAHCFFVVVQNVQKVSDRMTVSASAWWDCLRFTFTINSGKIYSVSRPPISWSCNPIETWIFPSGGMCVIPVDFNSGAWQGLPPTPSGPKLVTVTAVFRYPDSSGKWRLATSRPTQVYLCPKP